ncbi:MAG: hypothetical protein K5668_00630 [Lachnospiraceae bacterium]|nr:hypothetical protein [Lachnospiraceae bacterium]
MSRSNFEEGPLLEPVTNEDLICRDCVYRLEGGDVMVCEKYDVKPDSVITDDSCEEYE